MKTLENKKIKNAIDTMIVLANKAIVKVDLRIFDLIDKKLDKGEKDEN